MSPRSVPYRPGVVNGEIVSDVFTNDDVVRIPYVRLWREPIPNSVTVMSKETGRLRTRTVHVSAEEGWASITNLIT